MNIGPPLVADGQPAEAVEPGERTLHHPAVTAAARARVDPLARDADADVALAQGTATAGNVVGLVGVQLGRALAPPSIGLLDRGHGIEQIREDGAVVPIGAAQERGERDPGAVAHKVALRAGRPLGLATIRRGGADQVAPLLAGTRALSKLARLQSIWPASPNRSSSARWSRAQTPASCQSRRRRQQVIPEPPPSSWGSISQGMPLFSTKMMPVKAARSGTRGRPPLGLGGSGGSSGATTAHRSSLTRGLAIRQGCHVPHRF